MVSLNSPPLECEAQDVVLGNPGVLEPSTHDPMQVGPSEGQHYPGTQGLLERTGPGVLTSPVFVNLPQTWDTKGSSQIILILFGCQPNTKIPGLS